MVESLFRRAFKTLLIIVVILLVVCLYRAFVIIKPCSHKIENIKAADRIDLDETMQNRLIEALKIKTITFNENSQNITAIEIFGKFIRDGMQIFLKTNKYHLI
jgi:hypothetical protein